MKKLLGLILAMAMVLSLVACGGKKTEDNNAAVQAKMDELEAAYQDIYSYYEDNGLLAEGTPEGLVTLTDGHNETKATFESNLADGYSEEEADAMITLLDEQIVIYNDMLEGMKAIMAE